MKPLLAIEPVRKKQNKVSDRLVTPKDFADPAGTYTQKSAQRLIRTIVAIVGRTPAPPPPSAGRQAQTTSTAGTVPDDTVQQ